MKINKKIILQIILLILIICISSIIFGFSSQDGETSQGLSRKISGKIVDIVSVNQELSEYEREARIDRVDAVIRKIAHFSLYTLLGITIMAFFCTIEMKDKKRAITTIILGVLYATTDEIHQIFVPGRSPKVTDVFIDTAGIIFGLFIVLFVIKIYQKRILKRK